MPFELVEQPVAGADAFEQSSDAALLSQAAFLVAVGARIRMVRSIEDSDLRAVGVPEKIPPFVRDEVLLIPPASTRERMVRELGARNFPPDIDSRVQPKVIAEIIRIIEGDPNPQWVAGLFEAALRHPHELVRVASAGGYQGFTSEKSRILRILVDGTFSDEPLVRDLASIALAQADPGNARLTGLESKSMAAGGGQPSHTTLLVHGTFARHQTWWQPGGDFHSSLTTLLPTLPRVPRWDAPYAVSDRFEWTGGYDAEKRSMAADELVQWANSHDAQGLDLIAHSYGGNVAMLATNRGLKVRELVLLSCPALPELYLPNFSQVEKRVVSFRVRMDIVLMLDSYYSGALARFWEDRLAENILPLWFDHSLTHNPDVWKNAKYRIPGIS